MKKIILCVSLSMSSILLQAQTGNKAIYAEIGGPGFISVNFDARCSRKSSGFGVRTGVGVVPNIFNTGVAVPLGINFLAGKNKYFLEAELGASYIHLFASHTDGFFKENASSQWIGYWYVGYRYKSPHGTILRVGFNPLYSAVHGSFFSDDVRSFHPWAGVSFGHSF